MPPEAGLIVAHDGIADLLRAAPEQPLPSARRRALLHRFAHLAADRVAMLTDPAGWAESQMALRAE